ncbi:MAG: ribosome silencing factor [Firmicutes bacterium]|nr:ribosome silencing factor [Bacillota bacterium]
MDYDKVLSAAYTAVIDQKGENPVILDLRELTVVTDYFLITTGRNPNHLKALADQVLEKLGALGLTPSRREGDQNARWVLLDYGFLVVHLLGQDEREFYRLEELWYGAKRLTPTMA